MRHKIEQNVLLYQTHQYLGTQPEFSVDSQQYLLFVHLNEKNRQQCFVPNRIELRGRINVESYRRRNYI